MDNEGFVDLNELETVLKAYNQTGNYGNKRIKLVAVNGASNVLGVCNNIMEISRIVHLYGARLLVDAAQMVAHRKIEMDQWSIDYLAFSSHKVYAPFGTGVLIVKKGVLKFSAAEMELIHTSAEENAGGIAALGKALLLIQNIGMDIIQEEEQTLTKQALIGMSKIQGLVLYGIKNPESPRFTNKIGVIAFSMKSMMPNRLAGELAERYGIGVRYGCHCAHILVKRILNVGPSLEKFQRFILKIFPKLRLPGIARVSIGIENSEEEIDKLIKALGNITRKPTGSKSGIQKQINDFVKDSARRVYSRY